MIQQHRRAEDGRGQRSISPLLASGPVTFFTGTMQPSFNDEAAVAFFVGVNPGGSADLSRVEARLPAETAADGVDEFVGGEADSASFR